MPSKEYVIENLKEKTYSFSEVKHLMGTISSIQATLPRELKRGDVIKLQVGVKTRPTVIIKVLEEIVVGVPLSTTEDCLNLSNHSSRFFGDGYFSNQLVTACKEHAMENFIGVYDNPKLLNVAIKKLKEFANSVL